LGRWVDWVTRDSRGNHDGGSGQQADQVSNPKSRNSSRIMENSVNTESQVTENSGTMESRGTKNSANTESQVMENSANTER
jgi:hypothetical protein